MDMEKVFEILDEEAPEWRSATEEANDEEVRKRVSEVALAEVLNQQMKEEDQDLESAKHAAKTAAQQYVDAHRVNKAKLKFAKYLLESRGKE